MSTAHLSMGSNLGDRLGHLRAAIAGLRAEEDIEVVALSRVYETTPVGGPEQGRYLNAVITVVTHLAPVPLLRRLQALENASGRVRAERNGPRTLDLDVLLVDDVVIDEPDLVVPHPRMHERGFVLAPLADVAPELVVRPTDGWPGVIETDLVL